MLHGFSHPPPPRFVSRLRRGWCINRWTQSCKLPTAFFFSTLRFYLFPRLSIPSTRLTFVLLNPKSLTRCLTDRTHSSVIALFSPMAIIDCCTERHRPKYRHTQVLIEHSVSCPQKESRRYIYRYACINKSTCNTLPAFSAPRDCPTSC